MHLDFFASRTCINQTATTEHTYILPILIMYTLLLVNSEMIEMKIPPSGGSSKQQIYAEGRFSDSNSYIVEHQSGASPFGSMLCSLGSEYTVRLFPDGSSASQYAGLDVTPPTGEGKAWYIKDSESEQVWSPFLWPAYARSDEFKVSFSPGQAEIYSLKNKIACYMTIATVPDFACEVWLVRFENRSATSRTLSFTTYVEPDTEGLLESRFFEREKVLLMRRPLEALEVETSNDPVHDLVLFHSSTLAPSRYQTSKADFTGDDGSLTAPRHVIDNESTGANGPVNDAAFSMSVDVDLPIEGEAEFAFCFGAVDTVERALEMAQVFSKIESVTYAVEASKLRWQDLCSNINIKTQDKAFDALVNTWLPYEAYTEWMSERDNTLYVDPKHIADSLRRLYPFSGTAPGIYRKELLDFASRISTHGTFTTSRGSIVALPASELLWLAICTAKYIAETGDRSILLNSTSFNNGPNCTLQEHCERAIRMCLNTRPVVSSKEESKLLERTIELWSLITEETQELGKQLRLAKSRKQLEQTEDSEQRNLPRRVEYFQSISPTLAESDIEHKITGPSEDSECTASSACSLHSTLTESVLGLTATFDGLVLKPKLPSGWNECEITRRFRGDIYNIRIKRSGIVSLSGISIIADGEPVLGDMLPYSGDGSEHQVDVIIN